MARRPRTRKALEKAVLDFLDEHLSTVSAVVTPDLRPAAGAATTGDLERAHAYLTAAPRISAYGRLIAAADAASIVAKTLANGGSLRLATLLDMNDNRYGKIVHALRAAGAPQQVMLGGEPGPEQAVLLGALLWAEQVANEELFYHGGNAPAVTGFYALVAERPLRAGDIIGFARQRRTVEADVLRAMLDVDIPALAEGAL